MSSYSQKLSESQVLSPAEYKAGKQPGVGKSKKTKDWLVAKDGKGGKPRAE